MQAASASPLTPDLQRLIYDGYQYQLRSLLEEAARCYLDALRRAPGNPDVAHLLAMVRARQGRSNEAIQLYRSALVRKPNDAKIWHNLSLACSDAGCLTEAIAATVQALALEPGNSTFAGLLLSQRRAACDWTDHARLMADVIHFAPFFSLWSNDPEAQFTSAKRAAARYPTASRTSRPRRPGPIRLGYVSADFRDHPTTHLISDLLRAHDRSRFEVIAFSLGGEDGTPFRQQIRSAVDRFVACGNQSSTEIARAVEAADIDILIDVMGYTTGYRLDVFAQRPAPVQVSFLAYPGTSGASFIDYVIADAIVLPFDDAPVFSEKIVHVPGCYQPNAATLPIARRPCRTECGLPEAGIVFCSMNNLNKLDPETFDSFCRILAAVPGAVLWMLSRSDTAEANLRREADARGIAADRLVFARPLPLDQHLARLPLADIFLDSFPYTAHTTASDSVRMGVPLITRTGRTFASRVAASVLHHAGLDDFITPSIEEFEQLAISLARDPRRLGEARARVEVAACEAPLFNVERYARGIEGAFVRMIERAEAGEPPAAFAVA